MDTVLLQIYNQDMIFLTIPMWFDEEDDGERIDSYTAQVTVDEPGTYTMKIKMETEHADLIGTGNGIVIEDPNTLTEVIK